MSPDEALAMPLGARVGGEQLEIGERFDRGVGW